MPDLRVEDLHVGYVRGLSILRGVSIVAGAARVTSVLGANGVGKSTLLKAVFGFLTPTEGHVWLGTTEITGRPPHEMSRFGLSYSPQQPGVFSEMSVDENILVGAWSFRSDRARVRQKLAESYERFPALKDRRHDKAGLLSGGQRRMVELARAMMSDPGFLLVDEPSAGLAPLVADQVYAELRALRSQGIGIVLVEQDISRALAVSDYVYVIDLGQNRLSGRPEELGNLESAFWSWDSVTPTLEPTVAASTSSRDASDPR
jgi:branched-chain amino acid transport system ATP-binding protein